MGLFLGSSVPLVHFLKPCTSITRLWSVWSDWLVFCDYGFSVSALWCPLATPKFGKLSSGHRTGKGQFSFQSQRKAAKECSNYHTVALISHTSKVMVKILGARLQQYMNCELPNVQASFRKGRGTRDQIANIHWIIEKAREFQKNIYFCFINYTKALDCVDHKTGKFFKRWEYQIIWPASWEICVEVRKQQLKLDMKQWTGSKLGKEYVKAVYCHPAYLTFMQRTSCEVPGWMKHKLESRLPGAISVTTDMQMTPSLWQKVKKN